MLAYLVRGLTRQEIAAALYVSINTVKTTLSSVYRKIGVEDPARHGGGRPQAVQWAIENGFVPEPKRLVNPHRSRLGNARGGGASPRPTPGLPPAQDGPAGQGRPPPIPVCRCPCAAAQRITPGLEAT